MLTLEQELAKRRNAEAACALEFLVYGDDGPRGPHAEHCVHEAGGDKPCSRVYDAMPYVEALPVPPVMYAGTGIGALYGLPGCEHHTWQLAGWTIETVVH